MPWEPTRLITVLCLRQGLYKVSNLQYVFTLQSSVFPLSLLLSHLSIQIRAHESWAEWPRDKATLIKLFKEMANFCSLDPGATLVPDQSKSWAVRFLYNSEAVPSLPTNPSYLKLAQVCSCCSIPQGWPSLHRPLSPQCPCPELIQPRAGRAQIHSLTTGPLLPGKLQLLVTLTQNIVIFSLKIKNVPSMTPFHWCDICQAGLNRENRITLTI